ncbi:hypothetical protein [Methylocaldum sp.]|uniref:O-antigen ligase family protein n=1 Tax=Methylocaldum sp. TaxID=1969727 RepID=UPI002D6E6F9A|nr:hypothetical protein [Methylocaldum sp.]HYE37379.1 hypothetical protein [Methylocaldum sp.]
MIIAIYLGILTAILIGTLKNPVTALVLAACMFALEQWSQASSVFFVEHGTLTNMVAGSLVLLGVVRALMRGSIRLDIYPKVGWLTLLLFLYAYCSTLWAPSFETSAAAWQSAFPYIGTIIFLAPLLVWKVKDIRTFCTGMIVLGAPLCILLLFTVRWELRQVIIASDAYGDVMGGNPLAVAQIAGYVAFLALFLRFRKRAILWHCARWAILAITIVLIVRSGSRGQLLGTLGVITVCWGIAHRVRSFPRVFAILFSLSLIMILVKWSLDWFWAEDIRFKQQALTDAAIGRLEMARALGRHWFSSPGTLLFGLGNSASYDPRILGGYIHIVPMEILGEEGIVGFVLYALILSGTIRSGFRSYRMVRNDDQLRSLFSCIAALWLFSFFLTFKQGNLLGSNEFFLYSILLAKFEPMLRSESGVGKPR